MSTDLGTAGEMKSRELVHFCDSTDAVRAGQQYPPAPRAAPSMYELEELNPSVSEATVYKHIQKLIDAGIVREVPLDDDQRRQGYPWKFYGLTEEGQTFLDEHNLAAEETLQQIYETISNKPEKMVKYENALARTTRNPDRISSVSVLNHLLISYSAASSWNSDHSGRRPSWISPCVSRYWSRASISSSSPYFAARSRRSSSSTSTWLSRRRQYER